MKKINRKFKIAKNIVAITIVTGLYIALNSKKIPENYTEPSIPFTEEDLISNVKFYVELENIKTEDDIDFNNTELYNLIKETLGKTPTKKDLESIEKIKITVHLSNSDLGDLKYLTNLTSLYIKNNDVNCSDIKYNQNLSYLELSECTIKNTSDLPNTLEHIIFKTSNCLDSTFVVPYFTTKLYLNSTIINNIHLKNPSILINLMINGHSIIDLNSIKDCTNLKQLYIIHCSNIKNPEVLGTLENLNELILDDYATIWLNKKLIKSLPISEEEKSKYIEEVEVLDIIAKTITSKDNSDKEKIASLCAYVLGRISYDEQIADNPIENDDLITDYNMKPIEYTLNTQKGICTNYACLFKALLNRVGIENYQLSNDNHTWNVIYDDNEYKGYDLTYLDQGPIIDMKDEKMVIIDTISSKEIIQEGQGERLYFYGFNIDEQANNYHQANQSIQQFEESIKNIGYINEKSKIKITIDNQTIIMIIKNISELTILLNIILLIINLYKLHFKEHEKNKKDIKKYEKKYQ